MGQRARIPMQPPMCIERIHFHLLFGPPNPGKSPCDLRSISCILSCPCSPFLVSSCFCKNLQCLFLLSFFSLSIERLNSVGNSDPGKGDISELPWLSLLRAVGFAVEHHSAGPWGLPPSHREVGPKCSAWLLPWGKRAPSAQSRSLGKRRLRWELASEERDDRAREGKRS